MSSITYSVCQFSYMYLVYIAGFREFQSHNINDVIHEASDARQVIIVVVIIK